MNEALAWAWRLVIRLADVWRVREVWVSFVLMTVLVVLTPRLRRESGGRAYWNRGLWTDLLYTLFYLGGVYSLLVSARATRGLDALVARHVPFLRQDLLSFLPVVAWFAVLLVVMDFCGYWAHRFLHRSRVLWLFHGIHHSQTDLSGFTVFRFHAGDVFFRLLVQYVPFTLLGSPDVAGVPLLWITAPLQVLHESLAHCDLPWTLGPIGRVVISPAFHRLHHSTEIRHHDSNYGLVFSVWDAAFGTANWSAERPAAYGAPALAVPESFLRQIAFPFVALARRLRSPAAEPVPAPGSNPS